LYQPEKDANGELIHHQEDHTHLLKRIITRLCKGYIPGLDLCSLRDALHDASTGLTYEAQFQRKTNSQCLIVNASLILV